MSFANIHIPTVLVAIVGAVIVFMVLRKVL